MSQTKTIAGAHEANPWGIRGVPTLKSLATIRTIHDRCIELPQARRIRRALLAVRRSNGKPLDAWPHDAMVFAAREVIGESITPVNRWWALPTIELSHERYVTYVNAGDTYRRTLMLIESAGSRARFVVGCWGDLVEQSKG